MKSFTRIEHTSGVKLLKKADDGIAFKWRNEWHVIVSNGAGWEHASISNRDGKTLASWEVMRDLKRLIWNEDEVAIQIHPAEANYVDNFEVLHLWRPINGDVPLPPVELIGIPGARLTL